ncbi:MAG: DEAD/DEAH box helicase [Desulfurivibrionaceae bacterium]
MTDRTPKNNNNGFYIQKGPIFGLDILKTQGPGEAEKPREPKKNCKTGKAVEPEKSLIPEQPWNQEDFQVAPSEGKVRFHDHDLPDPVMRGIHEAGFEYCTPIQAEILKHTLSGNDATGRAQTGTGKTAAFLITIFSRLLSQTKETDNAAPRSLIIAPTRELVMQIARDARQMGKHTGLNIEMVYGGTDYQKQKERIKDSRVDILVATPGRLLDSKRRQDIDLSQVEIFIIDEADRMLDMGFIPDVRQIVYSLPGKTKRQTLLFSATLTEEVNSLSSQWTSQPAVVEIEPEQVTGDSVQEVIYLATSSEKFTLIYNILQQEDMDRVLIFCNRKDNTNRLAQRLRGHNITCAVLSGDVPQDKRQKTLENFKNGRIKVLVATDVAGRGIHVEGISHVINYNLPYEPEDYVHRIGRTGRAGETGISISFASEDEAFYIPDIEEYIGHKLNCVYPEKELLGPPPESGARNFGKKVNRRAGSNRKEIKRN